MLCREQIRKRNVKCRHRERRSQTSLIAWGKTLQGTCTKDQLKPFADEHPKSKKDSHLFVPFHDKYSIDVRVATS